ncbi:MAG: HAMP domain-containing sensor histidine kinase [Myxococcota bacterium]
MNELVVVFATPLVAMFVLVALSVRRYGAIHWVWAVVASWLAGLVDGFGFALQPLAIALGSLTSVFFATGAYAYAGRRPGLRGWLAGASLPLALALGTALLGTGVGYAALAWTDTLALALAVHWTWPRGELRRLAPARAVPFGWVVFVPMNLYGQLSRSLGASAEWPTVVVGTGLMLLAIILLMALTARLVRDELLVRQGLEARLVEREGELEATLERVRASERLASVGTLAAGIAHQINNPIGAILAAAQFELSEPDEGKEAAGSVRSTLETIEREALRCARIVRSVLLFSRTDSGRFAAHDLRAIVAAASDATRDEARRRRATVAIDVPAEAVFVGGNEVELEQIVVNLIRNAIESRASGARVRVAVRLESTPTQAILTVRDDGDGLSSEAGNRLFEPFFTTKLREGGSGLGLSVVHGILRNHGGEIAIVPIVGPGTCFEVRLPRADSASAAGSIGPPVSRSLGVGRAVAG